MSDRDFADDAVESLIEAADSAHPEHGIKHALVGIGFALLDLAQAVREV